MIKKSSIVILLILLCYVGVAQHYNFSRLTRNNGLSNNQIVCIYKDSRGFMWFGTASGLNRFDGYDFKVYKHNPHDKFSILDNLIQRIEEDKDGRLWIETNKGNSIYNPSTDLFIQDATEELVKMGFSRGIGRIFFDSDKNIWIRTSSGLPEKYEVRTSKVIKFPKYVGDGNVPAQLVSLYSRNGKAWLLYDGGDIACYNIKNNKLLWRNSELKQKKQIGSANNIFVDSKENVWVSSYSLTEGAFRLDAKARVWTGYNAQSGAHRLTSSMILNISEDSKGNIWISTDHGGVNIVNAVTGAISYLKNNPLDDKSLSQNSPTYVYCDNLGIIWIGTYKQGICYTHDNIYKFNVCEYQAKYPDDYLKNDCNCFFEDRSGMLWVGTNGGGLIKYDANSRAQTVYSAGNGPGSVSGNIVVSLRGDSKGRLWVGSYMGGLDCYSGGSFKHYKHEAGKPTSLSSNSIYRIYEDRQKNIWIGTLDGCLDRFDEASGTFVHYRVGSNLITSIVEDPYGNMLMATPGGIYALNAKTGKVENIIYGRNGEKLNVDVFTNDIYLDSRGLLWMATIEGVKLYSYSTGKLIDLQAKFDDFRETFISIVEDKQGTIWLGSHNGLYSVVPNVDTKKGDISYKVRQFDRNDGLQGNEFNLNAMYLSDRGEVIVGGPFGYSRFYPSRIVFNNDVPAVAFTDFSVLNSALNKGEVVRSHIGLQNIKGKAQTVKLKYNERNISLQFAALTYFHPQKNKYKYILEGFDKQWTESGASLRKVTYTNLNPGTYTFKVLASNNDGVWMAEPAELRIVVKPPFWASSVAFIVYILLIIYGLYHLVQFFIRRQERRFIAEQERFETQKLLDLDEMKLQFFTNISHELRTPITLILSPLERLLSKATGDDDKKLLGISHSNAVKLLGMVNQLLDFRKLDANALTIKKSVGDLVPFVMEICQEFIDLAGKKQINLDFETNLGSVYVEFDQDKMYKAISNIISNAVKYTPNSGKVIVSMEVYANGANGNDLLQIKISDNGVGISAEDQARIFERFYRVESNNKNVTGTGIGLNLAHEFIKMHGGEITLQSTVGEGSCFTILLPIVSQQPLEEEMQIRYTLNSYQTEETLLSVVSKVDENAPTLLIVDDNDEFRDFMVSMLREHYNILTAADGKAALDIVQEKVPDIVLSDVMMPVMDGFELCRQIQNDIRTSHIPIILLTAKTGDDSKIAGLDAGANDYIAKPFNMEILLLKIKRLLKLRQLSQKKFQRKMEIKSTEIAISSLDEKLMKKATEYIETNMSNTELSVEDLSAHLAMSRVHLYKKLLSITGKTPIEFIRILRLKRAAQLLEKSQLSVNEVAYSVGFNDTKYFRRYFKEEFKLLPSEYKQRFNKSSQFEI